MKKGLLKVVSLGLAAVLSCGLLVGCGGNDSAGADDKNIKIGASPSPHAEILAQVEAAVEAQGYTLEIIEYNDYVIPNTAVEQGELDANFFQHKPYLDDFNANNGTNIVSVAAIHFEPLGIYSSSVEEVSEIGEGALIGVPNDATNEARALLLLEANGLITLKEGAGVSATINDIESNPLNLEIKEIEAAQLPLSLLDLDAAVINGNYAISGGLKVSDAIAVEESTSIAADTYANIVAVKAGNEENEKVQVLINALKSEEVKSYIESTYAGAVVPVF
ncbi:MAG: MetQ/NlpA family ABC transporter substrate-binding protein [Agathobacter sp.]|nr:MetQ/NlpA family ABC transporter substrate-binding protein [Agathobacter sp.]MBQ6812326.1 MetQ/NlpA family ABC transporter substrate-binding protein [Agathobacter sp.]